MPANAIMQIDQVNEENMNWSCRWNGIGTHPDPIFEKAHFIATNWWLLHVDTE